MREQQHPFTDPGGRLHATGGAHRTRVRAGLHADAEWWAALRPFERYAVRVRGTAWALDDPVLALESAALVHGLPVFGEPAIHLFSPTAARGYRHGDVVVHASADTREIVRVDGIRVTSLADTTLDLLRVLPLAPAVAVLDSALRAGLDLEAARSKLMTQVNRRGRATAEAAIARADVRSESVLESLSRVVIGLLGFPAPELQATFRLPRMVARADFFWRASGVVGEADGALKYFEAGTSTESVVRAERRREVELLRVVRRVARWEWPDVLDPRRLDRILTTAALARERAAAPLIGHALRNARTSP